MIRDCEKTSEDDDSDKEIGSLCFEPIGHLNPPWGVFLVSEECAS